MIVAPKLIAENVDVPTDLKSALLGIFRPEDETELKELCTINLNVPRIGKFPGVVFKTEHLKEFNGDTSMFRSIFNGNIECYMKIMRRGQKMYLDSIMFNAHQSEEKIRVELIDSDKVPIAGNIIAFTVPKQGRVEVSKKCTISLLHKKLGIFELDFDHSDLYGCKSSTCTHNDYLFTGEKDAIRVSITVTGDIYLSSVLFTTVSISDMPDEKKSLQ